MPVDFAEKKRPQRERVLDVLRDLEWHPYLDLAAVGGVRYSARLLELKRLGYEIEDRTVKGDTGKDYRLIRLEPGVPQEKLVKVFLTEAQAEAIVRHTHNWPPAVVEGRKAVQAALGSYRANRHKL